ncbi:bifunctional riboflavin kinase/FAD synthetase [Mumia flava]|uniref:bifunctional riboflavin kinase/FAD synthetase n=1 Tax=Mumia flava TaxID=1348852 RepID=UPI003CCC2352
MTVWRANGYLAGGPRTGPCVATLGVFDGVHVGHRRVVDRACEVAAAAGGTEPLPVVAVTFDPHPTAVFAPDRAPLALTTVHQRATLLRDAGAAEVRALAFDRAMASWSPEEFVERVLLGELKAAGVVVGSNFTYGTKAGGNVDTLAASGREHGFTVDVLPLEEAASGTVSSSTYIRAMLAAGDVEAARRALGRPHSLCGVVVEGDKRGRAMGFPTANVAPPTGFAVPADGVYAGWLTRLDDGTRYPAAISVGTNPTFDGVSRRVESYVLDRDDLDLYGVEVEIAFSHRVRGQVRFDSMDELVARMHLDVAEVREVLAPQP